MQRPESGTTGLLTGYSDILEKTVTEGSRKLPFHTTGPYIVRSATEGTLTLEKDGVAVPMSLGRLIETPQVSDGTEHLTVLHDNMG